MSASPKRRTYGCPVSRLKLLQTALSSIALLLPKKRSLPRCRTSGLSTSHAPSRSSESLAFSLCRVTSISWETLAPMTHRTTCTRRNSTRRRIRMSLRTSQKPEREQARIVKSARVSFRGRRHSNCLPSTTIFESSHPIFECVGMAQIIKLSWLNSPTAKKNVMTHRLPQINDLNILKRGRRIY